MPKINGENSQKTIQKQQKGLDKRANCVYDCRINGDGEEYLLLSPAQGVADSGTAARTAAANGLRRVCPKVESWGSKGARGNVRMRLLSISRIVGQNGNLHPLSWQRISSVCG